MEYLFSEEQKTILKLVSDIVFEKDVVIENDGLDDLALMNEAGHQAVIPAVFEGVCKHGLFKNSAVYNDFFKKSVMIMSKNHTLLLVQDVLCRLFKENGIPFVIIKGSAVGCMYKNPGIRCMGDIDVLVNYGESFEDAVDIIISAGFHYVGGEGDIHREFSYKGCTVELHYDVNGIPDGKLGEEIREFLNEVITRPVLCIMDGYKFPALDEKRHGVLLLLHNYEHLQGGGIGLRHLLDWGVYSLNYLNGYEGFNEIVEVFKKFGIKKFASVMTLAANKYFDMGMDFCWCDNVDDTILNKLVADIFEGGNFGFKSPDERYASEIIVKKKSEDKKSLKRIFSNFAAIVKTSMPITKKAPVLMIFAPVYIPIRYIFRVITGKRRLINPIKTVKESNRRRKLYDEFNMFNTK